jgi:hypothetical protein
VEKKMKKELDGQNGFAYTTAQAMGPINPSP